MRIMSTTFCKKMDRMLKKTLHANSIKIVEREREREMKMMVMVMMWLSAHFTVMCGFLLLYWLFFSTKITFLTVRF